MPSPYLTLEALPEPLRAQVATQVQALHAAEHAGIASALQQPQIAASLPQVFASSELVANACLRDLDLLPRLYKNGRLLESVNATWLRSELDTAIAAVA